MVSPRILTRSDGGGGDAKVRSANDFFCSLPFDLTKKIGQLAAVALACAALRSQRKKKRHSMALPVYVWIIILVVAAILLIIVPGALKIAVIVLALLLLIIFVPWQQVFHKGSSSSA
jgi:hypothetical protein